MVCSSAVASSPPVAVELPVFATAALAPSAELNEASYCTSMLYFVLFAANRRPRTRLEVTATSRTLITLTEFACSTALIASARLALTAFVTLPPTSFSSTPFTSTEPATVASDAPDPLWGARVVVAAVVLVAAVVSREGASVGAAAVVAPNTPT